MGQTTQRMLIGGGAVAGVVAISFFVATDGYYPIRIWKDTKGYHLDGKPDPAPYRLDGFLRDIEWRFENATGDSKLTVRVDTFQCNNVPVQDCPLRLDPQGSDCSSADLPIPVGATKSIFGQENANSTCTQSTGVDLWEYRILLTTSDGIAIPDPELEIDRTKLGRIVQGLTWVFRRIHRLIRF